MGRSAKLSPLLEQLCRGRRKLRSNYYQIVLHIAVLVAAQDIDTRQYAPGKVHKRGNLLLSKARVIGFNKKGGVQALQAEHIRSWLRGKRRGTLHRRTGGLSTLTGSDGRMISGVGERVDCAA